MSAPSASGAPLRAEVLAIGDELTHGSAIDTNSAWISRRLEALGFAVQRFTVCSDHPGELDDALKSATERSDVLICTGGLGPTEDDRTRHAIADAMGADLEFDETTWGWMEEYFAERQRPLREDNRRQALVPVGSESLRNLWGTAAGVLAVVQGCHVFALPGVPREMKAMVEHLVEPRLRKSFANRLRPVAHRTLRVLGPSEAQLGKLLEDVMQPDGDVAVGITAHYGLLSIRIAAHGDDPTTASQAAESLASDLRTRVAEWLIHEGDTPPLQVVVEQLLHRDLTITTAESCTGGLLAKSITDLPGTSAIFPGGWITYSNESKQRDLGVPAALIEQHGAVSTPVAQAMARGAAQKCSAHIGVGISGIAGPDGGSEDKPVGTVCFGLTTPTGDASWERRLPPVNREFVRERAVFEVVAALLGWLRDGRLPS